MEQGKYTDGTPVIAEVKLVRCNQHGYCILEIRKTVESMPDVQLQFPTDIAQYIKNLIEADQDRQFDIERHS